MTYYLILFFFDIADSKKEADKFSKDWLKKEEPQTSEQEDVNLQVGDLESAIRKKMAPRVAFWVDRHVGPKFTVFVWEFDGK